MTDKLNKIHIYAIIAILMIMLGSSRMYAFSTDRYAENSVLAEGRWVKIKVSETGMQFISNSQLKSWGFSDPSKVNVYGYGGRMISEILDQSHPDDLPLLPVCRTDNGLVFYGVNTISWENSGNQTVTYIPQQNMYSSQSCYFLSDREITPKEIQKINATPSPQSSETITSFTERLVHERELYAPSNTGRVLVGEDFRSTSTQTFSFNLPGQLDDEVNVLVNFATRTTGGGSSLLFKANSNAVSATNSDKIGAVTSDDTHYKSTATYKKITGISERLDLQISFSSQGVLYMARLDNIIVNYQRQLKLIDGKLLFHLKMRNKDVTVKIDGCSANTKIWDVTQPQNPQEISFSLVGSEAQFSPQGSGEREYVAFNPESVTQSPENLGIVSNQNIHGMSVPDMVIITLPEFHSQAKRIATLHEEVDTMTVYVINQQDIFNEFSSGSPDFSAFRKMLKMWYDRSTAEKKLGYCILFGRPSYDNRMLTETVKSSGYPRLLTWQSANSEGETSSYCTDDLIAMLEDGKSSLDMTSEPLSIAVGRMPVRTLSEAITVVNKLIKYVKEPSFGAWRNTVMLIADDENEGVHLDQAESVYELMQAEGNGKDFIYERLYLDSYPLGTSSTGKSYPAARERMFKMFDDGVMYVDYIGHANTTSWTHERLLTYSDILNMNNKNLPFMATYTCEFTRWDDDDFSGAEIMWADDNGGAIGFISAIRKVYIANNGDLNDAISEALFQRDENGLPKRLGDIYKEGKNKVQDGNKLRFIFMGDPAMRLQSPSLNVVIDEFAGKDMTNSTQGEFPVVSARGKVTAKGRILNVDGTVATDFNGVLIPTLFDAERVIETYGNGSQGKKRMYNDRKNKLFVSKVQVAAGEWEATILMPSEIDNNYSPALLNLYAYSDDGREANGSTTDFYVYGWDENAQEDLEGPNINILALNTENFEDGGVVNDSPVLLASVQDDSGINISTSGIGHQMTIILDGKTVYDDLVDYYQPDINDYTAGNVIYQLSELEAGEHTLSFTVWDNANNSSTKSLTFNVSKTLKPQIYDIYTNANPASTSATFYVSHDRPATPMTVTLDVFDLGGRKVWTTTSTTTSDFMTPVEFHWDLTDMSGVRVQRGIYLYRATIATNDSAETTMTKKIAVTAQ